MIRKLHQQYVITNYRTFPGQHLHHVVQSYDMRLVASVHTYLATPAGEHMRRRFLSNSASPYHWAKVPGLRVYLMLEGSMRSIFPDEEEARKEEIHNILLEMAQFYKEYGLTEGQHRQYADREVAYTPNTPENDTPAE
mgnify:FL=1